MSLEDLSYEHEEQLKSFLKFFRSKRNYQIQEVEACFADQLDQSAHNFWHDKGVFIGRH